MFNIKLGNSVVLENLDIYAKAGKFAAHDEYIEFDWKNSVVSFKGAVIDDAVIKGNLQLWFEKTEKDNPLINGIILYRGSIAGIGKN